MEIRPWHSSSYSASGIGFSPSRFVRITLFSVLLRGFWQLGYSAPRSREKLYHLVHLKSDGDESGIRKDSSTTDSEVDVGKDIKENFEARRENDPVMPNIWYPDGVLPGFNDVCMDSSG